MTRAPVTFLNEDTETSPGRTVMVFGVGRGGTSAVSGMLRELGLSMGDGLHPLKHEWSPLAYDGDAIDIDSSAMTIAAMNAKHLHWGWKSPRDIFSLDKYLHLLRNPRVVIVFRNMLDNLVSAARHDAMDLPPLADGIGQVFLKLSIVLGTVTVPTALISYETLTSDSPQVVRDISAWLGLECPDTGLAAAARFVSGENARYRAISSDAKHAQTVISQADLDQDRSAAHARIYPRATASLTAKSRELEQEAKLLSAAIDVLAKKLAHTVAARHPGRVSGIHSRSLDMLLCQPIPVIRDVLGFDPFQGSKLPQDIEGGGAYLPPPASLDGDQWEADYRAARARYKDRDRRALALRRTKQILEWRLWSLEHGTG